MDTRDEHYLRVLSTRSARAVDHAVSCLAEIALRSLSARSIQFTKTYFPRKYSGNCPCRIGVGSSAEAERMESKSIFLTVTLIKEIALQNDMAECSNF